MASDTPPVSLVNEDACRRFEAAWAEGRPAPLEHFLPEGESPGFLATLEEPVHIKLEFAWKARRRPGRPTNRVWRSASGSPRPTPTAPRRSATWRARTSGWAR
jgi:hypothetical protein